MALTKTGTDGLKDDAVSLAKMAGGTDGQIITYDASGNPTAVGPGTDGQVLTSTGAGSPPAFEDAAGGVAGISSSADATAITIDSSEHVIVGGTTVSGVHANNQDFVVGNTSNSATGMALNCASGGYISIVMSDGQGDKNKGLIAYNHADDTFKLVNDPASGYDTLVLQSDHNVKVGAGNLVIGTAGKGIDFSAQTVTSVTGTTASQTTEVLDHYEEGSWTPSCQTGSGGGAGQYVRIGNLVTITGYINPQDTSSSNTVHLENIPYPATSGGGTGWNGAVRGYHINDINSKRAHVSVVDTNDTVQFGTLESANAWTMLKHNNIASTNNAINFTITYRTDA